MMSPPTYDGMAKDVSLAARNLEARAFRPREIELFKLRLEGIAILLHKLGRFQAEIDALLDRLIEAERETSNA